MSEAMHSVAPTLDAQAQPRAPADAGAMLAAGKTLPAPYPPGQLHDGAVGRSNTVKRHPPQQHSVIEESADQQSVATSPNNLARQSHP